MAVLSMQQIKMLGIKDKQSKRTSKVTIPSNKLEIHFEVVRKRQEETIVSTKIPYRRLKI